MGKKECPQRPILMIPSLYPLFIYMCCMCTLVYPDRSAGQGPSVFQDLCQCAFHSYPLLSFTNNPSHARSHILRLGTDFTPAGSSSSSSSLSFSSSSSFPFSFSSSTSFLCADAYVRHARPSDPTPPLRTLRPPPPLSPPLYYPPYQSPPVPEPARPTTHPHAPRP